ncbi:MAG: 3-oxoacyl-ACP reductase FabG [Desulfarculus sp.]|jgi:NAD(P)-dependent dehydrogenase (short-subunit alcohol dehydrogenase family)|nr:MAG: 3-oxoacyl-ACP reductase FabG [Desulfarculus sp.]
MRLQGKAALITGGGRGIGWAIAQAFGAQGAQVGIMELQGDNFAQLRDEARARGFELITLQGDVTKKEQIEKAVADLVAAFGKIDILVNNAGIVISRPFLEKTAQEWMKTLEVNLVGPFLCCQVAAPYMLKQKYGKIVNISSIRGFDHCGREGVMDYCASKGAIINFTKTLAKELAPHINVNSVAPGHTNTTMVQGLPEEVRRNMIEGSYLKRLAEPEDIAQAVLFMSSDEAKFITGQVLLVDGGFHLKRN